MGEPGKSSKQLHLVVADTGDDLGLFVGGASAYVESLSAVVAYDVQGNLAYAESGCRGTALIQWPWNTNGPFHNVAIVGPTGVILHPTAAPQVFHERSWRERLPDGSTRCSDAEGDIRAVPFLETVVRAEKHAPSDLMLELR